MSIGYRGNRPGGNGGRGFNGGPGRGGRGPPGGRGSGAGRGFSNPGGFGRGGGMQLRPQLGPRPNYGGRGGNQGGYQQQSGQQRYFRPSGQGQGQQQAGRGGQDGHHMEMTSNDNRNTDNWNDNGRGGHREDDRGDMYYGEDTQHGYEQEAYHHDMTNVRGNEDGFYNDSDLNYSYEQDGYYGHEDEYDGDLEGYHGEDMFFLGEPTRSDPEQLDMDDSDVELSDDDVPPLLNRESLNYESDSDSDDEEERPMVRKKITYNSRKEQPEVAQVDLSPLTIGQAARVGNIDKRMIFKTLFDSGATGNMVKRSALPKEAKLTPLEREEGIQTTNRTMQIKYYVILDKLVFPEFSPNRYISNVKCYVYEDTKVRYDFIIGRRTMKEMELKLDFKKEEMQWIDTEVPFHPTNWYSDKEAIRRVLSVAPVRVQQAEAREAMVTEIKAAKYGKVDLNEVVSLQTHLTKEQRKDLYEVLKKNEDLFDGRVGRFPRDFHLDVDPNIEPVCQTRPYPLNAQHLNVLKEELDRQEAMGIISKCYEATRWCMPMFIRPKKDGTVRTVHDFRALNKAILRKKHTLPRIEDILMNTKPYRFLTKIDVSMQYYTFYLDEESRWYCVFITPFGKYILNTLAMGLVQSADFAQAAMEETLADILDKVSVYMDDIKFQDMEWKDHMEVTDQVLTRLRKMGFTVNPLKCEWGVKETDFLGYILTPNGAKPWTKRIEPIMAMETPRTLTELRRFIGMVNFYQPMFQKRAHVLAPLTGMTQCKPQAFKGLWTKEHDEAFKQVKALISKEVLLKYPDLNAEFVIETDASDYQLGAVIKQHGQPIAFYSRKLTNAQRKYSTLEKELLSILEVLEEYRSLLWGRQLRIKCDHKNISYGSMKSNRVKNWRLLIEDFGPNIEFYPGELNVEADTVSRHPTRREQTDASKILEEVMLNYPANVHQFPAQFHLVQQSQQANQHVIDLVNEEGYEYRTFGGQNLVCRQGQHGEWKIVLPGAMVNDVMEWYHTLLSHPGITRMEQTIGKLF